jgi:hypothetical protein
MRRTILLIVLVCSVFGTPLLCDAGVGHECLCAIEECCGVEFFCEWDRCDTVIKLEEVRRSDDDLIEQPLAQSPVRVDPVPRRTPVPTLHSHLPDNIPVADSDLPLLI